MSSEIATQQTNPFLAYAQAANTRTIIGSILKFRKGDWSAGQNDDEIALGTQFTANMDELMVGWVKWEDARPVEHVMGRVIDGYVPPSRKSLGDTDQGEWDMDDRGQPRDPWQLTNYLLLKDNADRLYTFPANSKGAINAVAGLAGEFGKAMRQRPNDFPIVTIGADSYKHPKPQFGRIYYPTFKITGWAPKTDFEGALVAAAQAEADQAAADLANGEAAPAVASYAAAKGKSPRKPLFAKQPDEEDDVPF